MAKSMNRGTRLAEHIKSRTHFGAAMRGAGQALLRVPHGDGWKGGSWDQVGREFLFEGGKVTWCHRMRNTTDHSDISRIREMLGLPAK